MNLDENNNHVSGNAYSSLSYVELLEVAAELRQQSFARNRSLAEARREAAQERIARIAAEEKLAEQALKVVVLKACMFDMASGTSF